MQAQCARRLSHKGTPSSTLMASVDYGVPTALLAQTRAHALARIPASGMSPPSPVRQLLRQCRLQHISNPLILFARDKGTLRVLQQNATSGGLSGVLMLQIPVVKHCTLIGVGLLGGTPPHIPSPSRAVMVDSTSSWPGHQNHWAYRYLF